MQATGKLGGKKTWTYLRDANVLACFKVYNIVQYRTKVNNIMEIKISKKCGLTYWETEDASHG